MLKKIAPIVLISFLLLGCSNNNTFTITNDSIGPLTRNSTAADLKVLFASDSIVNPTGSGRTYKIYEKGGNQLLSLEAEGVANNSAFKSIRVFDQRYTTEKGIHLGSTFKDISGAYSIKRIDNILGAIVLFLEDSDAYFTIDKKHLPGELMFDTSLTIEKTQIPDETPIKYFMIGW